MKSKKKNKPTPLSYQNRTYRQLVDGKGLEAFEVRVKETDLHILASLNRQVHAKDLVLQYRNQLENYIDRFPQFAQALDPLPIDPHAPKIIQKMIAAGLVAEVGPMAAVAGVMAELVGEGLLKNEGVDEVMVENGGDIFISRNDTCTIAIFAGDSPLSQKVGVRVAVEQMPLGICTSSASVGHSLSLGQADAVTVLAASTALADAVATRLGNEAKDTVGIDEVLEKGASFEGVQGVVVIKGEQLGAWGAVELVGVEV